MNGNKVYSYLGFAAKSRNLVTGYNTCEMMIKKKAEASDSDRGLSR